MSLANVLAYVFKGHFVKHAKPMLTCFGVFGLLYLGEKLAHMVY